MMDCVYICVQTCAGDTDSHVLGGRAVLRVWGNDRDVRFPWLVWDKTCGRCELRERVGSLYWYWSHSLLGVYLAHHVKFLFHHSFLHRTKRYLECYLVRALVIHVLYVCITVALCLAWDYWFWYILINCLYSLIYTRALIWIRTRIS